MKKRMLSLSEMARSRGGLTYEDVNGDLEWLIEQITSTALEHENRAENLLTLIAMLERVDEDTRDCLFEQIIRYIYARTGHHDGSCRQFIDGLLSEPRKLKAKTKGGKTK